MPGEKNFRVKDLGSPGMGDLLGRKKREIVAVDH